MILFFLLWTFLNFERPGYIRKGTPDVEFEQDWSLGLGAILADGQKIKNYFSNFRDFSGKSR